MNALIASGADMDTITSAMTLMQDVSDVAPDVVPQAFANPIVDLLKEVMGNTTSHMRIQGLPDACPQVVLERHSSKGKEEIEATPALMHYLKKNLDKMFSVDDLRVLEDNEEDP